MEKPAFWQNEKRYYDLKSYFKNRFGCIVYKLPLDAGFTCPNRDGTLGLGGCIYCDGRGSPLRREGKLPSITEQLRRGIEFYRRRCKAAKFIAYFQTFTNTYAPVNKLKALYDEALDQEDVVGLAVGTRPDCVPEPVLDLLDEYGRKYHVWLELGLQSIHEKTLTLINRGHNYSQFLDALSRASRRNILICTHIIVGLPGESREDILKTAKALAHLPIDGIKIHLLLALRGTPLGAMYEKGEIKLLTKEAYVELVCDILEVLPPQLVIQRLTADGYRDIFLGPSWAVNKMEVLNAIDRELKVRNTYQGKKFSG